MDDADFTASVVPHLIVTGFDQQGHAIFVEDPKLIQQSFDNLGGVVWLWQAAGLLSIPGNTGTFPPDGAFPLQGELKFGVVWIAPESEGVLDFSQGDVASTGEFAPLDDPTFHTSDALELAVMLSGEADIELPGGASRTMKAGSCIVQAGAPHKWRNRGNAPCVSVMIAVGANRELGSRS